MTAPERSSGPAAPPGDTGAYEEFTDPRLAAVYDLWDPGRDDVDFYLGLADEEPGPADIADIGCGTGLLAAELARRGHRVTGVDPAGPMLAVARDRPGGRSVSWLEGRADRLPAAAFDLVVLSGHIPQVVSDDRGWHAVLAGAHRALRPGGRIAFESRDPAARGWLDWTPEASRRTIGDASTGPIEVWSELVGVDGEMVRSELHYRFAATGEELVSRGRIRFRTRDGLLADLARAGFTLLDLFGGHDRRPPGPGTPEMVFVARRDPSS